MFKSQIVNVTFNLYFCHLTPNSQFQMENASSLSICMFWKKINDIKKKIDLKKLYPLHFCLKFFEHFKSISP
jgi:hypothetical protein